MRTITGELKQWYRYDNQVIGCVYNDTTRIYRDGEKVTKEIKYIIQHTGYWILYTSAFVYIMHDEEEVKDEHHRRTS